MGHQLSDIQTTRSSGLLKRPAKQPPEMVEGGGCISPIWEQIVSVFRGSKKHDQDEASRGGAAVILSGFKGVFYHRPSDRWKAIVWDDKEKKNLDLGSFFTPTQAARAYDRVVINGTSMVNFQKGTSPVLNFERADYSREMKQLMETSQERLVLLIRKQSAGAGRPQPDYSCTSL